MKKLVSNKVSFIQISTFYDPINILGKGASAKVLLNKKL